MYAWACQLHGGQGTTTACTKKSENHPDSCASAGIETMVGPALRVEFPTGWFDDQAALMFGAPGDGKNRIAVKLQKIHHQATVPPLKFPVQARNKSLSFLWEEFYKRMRLFIFRCDTRCWNFTNYTHSLPQIWRVTNIISLRLHTQKKCAFPGLQHKSA